ncbi:YlzJ-like family protein [Dehalobacterium formicoaceticum]|uniref:YlzJ-like family protein n=1 Tax=Dehalobacterium formicoaceticum TaxID=51515 RepID=A0ABT1Y4V7_9FIRM|nr:YlzJ-like family protein [Dehalobacterium formicoaceticum]MCR6545913.1 YlzJ-like family protein [Dehalobacterium formicoaceticum]
MLWTIMPEEMILEGYDQKREYQVKKFMGRDFIVESGENNQDVIVQLLSTDPNDFLKQSFGPGNGFH